MDAEAEEKLRKEVQYLTRLINAHKAIQKLQVKEKIKSSSVATRGSVTTSSIVTSRTLPDKSAASFKWSSSPRGSRERRIVLAPSWSNTGSITAHTVSGTLSSSPSFCQSSKNTIVSSHVIMQKHQSKKASAASQHTQNSLQSNSFQSQASNTSTTVYRYVDTSDVSPQLTQEITSKSSRVASTYALSRDSPTDLYIGRDIAGSMSVTVNTYQATTGGGVKRGAEREVRTISVGGDERIVRIMDERPSEGGVAQRQVIKYRNDRGGGGERQVIELREDRPDRRGGESVIRIKGEEARGGGGGGGGGGIGSGPVRTRLKPQIPDRSKLRWQRKSPSKNKGQTLQSTTNSLISTPKSAIRQRKRTRSSGSSSSLHGVFSRSPFIVRRYKLMRIAPSKSSPTTFSQRRIHYMMKHALTSPVAMRETVGIKCSVHRVWTASATSNSQSPTRGGVMEGREVKTRQGNRQWVAKRSADKTPASKKKRRRSSTQERGTPHHGSRNSRRRRSRGRRNLVSIDGANFFMSSSGKKLRRVPSAEAAVRVSTPKRARLPSNTPTRLSTVKRKLASHVVRKSLNRVWLAKQTSKRKEVGQEEETGPSSSSRSKQFCTYYNRFGRCNRGNDCPFIHDPKRIAICSKFLKGKCTKTDGSCPFSHNLSKEKMPVCSFFLRGLCTREACPYLHVSVGKDAQLCPEFLKGFCVLGEKCTKKHVVNCPDFSQTGECPRGRSCPLRHFKKARKRRSVSEDGEKRTREDTRRVVTATKEPSAFRRLRRALENKRIRLDGCDQTGSDHTSSIITPAQLEFIPLDTDTAPDFIAL